MKRILTSFGAACVVAGSLATTAFGDVDEASFKVIGLWNIGPMYKEHEAPL